MYIEEISNGISKMKATIDQKQEAVDLKEIEFRAYKEHFDEELEADVRRLNYLKQCYLEAAGECFVCNTHAEKRNGKWICKYCNCEV